MTPYQCSLETAALVQSKFNSCNRVLGPLMHQGQDMTATSTTPIATTLLPFQGQFTPGLQKLLFAVWRQVFFSPAVPPQGKESITQHLMKSKCCPCNAWMCWVLQSALAQLINHGSIQGPSTASIYSLTGYLRMGFLTLTMHLTRISFAHTITRMNS